jgi:predicted N-formylglutamate amidohydrolase
MSDLLSPNDPAPFEVVNPSAKTPLLLTADHAGIAVPERLNNFGLPPEDLRRHIGWDIGAAGVARHLAQKLEATAVLAVYSRLLIDPNRPLGDPDCAPAASDGTVIAANQNVTAEEFRRRGNEVYWPYHCAVDDQIARLRVAKEPPAVVAVHSFTPMLMKNGAPRPWQVGIMFSFDDRLGRHLIVELQKLGFTVGENEPYSGFTLSYAQKRHGLAQMLPHAQIEIRQDLIGDAAGQEKWADILAGIFTASWEKIASWTK